MSEGHRQSTGKEPRRYKCKLERCERLIENAEGSPQYCGPECREQAHFLRCVVNAVVLVPEVLN